MNDVDSNARPPRREFADFSGQWMVTAVTRTVNAQALLDCWRARMERRVKLATLFGHQDIASLKRAEMEFYREPMGVSIEA